MPRVSPVAAIAATIVLACTATALRAQDPAQGVRLTLEYRAGARPGVLVLPVGGPQGDSVRTMLERDLDFGNRVSIVALAGADAASLAPVAGRPLNWALLGRLGAAGVVQAASTPAGLQVTVYDVGRQSVLDSQTFPLTPAPLSRDWRHAVHGISDEIEGWLTGTRGIARTRIAFVRGTALFVVDSDGAMETGIPVVSPPLSPAWHPSGTALAYNTYGVGSRVMVHDFATGRARTVSSTAGGVNQTPVFSPDGRDIVYAYTGEDGNAELYRVGASGGSARRITTGRGSLNLSPSFSPDGRRMVFTSSRAGQPEVYIMDADGTNTELLTSFVFGEQSYQSNSDWSPDGRLVAYQAQIAGRFQIKTIAIRDRGTRVLTSEGQNEDPSWAPDGRHLVFTSTRSGARQLWIVDVESGRMRQLTRSPGARAPAWSRR
ncbi:MAG: PD40 domain-containing protein [Gemmatimonadaceae bacterium]|nr:PD40 domain-containing protein [Gemmatimonadaceae bacterium]